MRRKVLIILVDRPDHLGVSTMVQTSQCLAQMLTTLQTGGGCGKRTMQSGWIHPGRFFVFFLQILVGCYEDSALILHWPVFNPRLVRAWFQRFLFWVGDERYLGTERGITLARNYCHLLVIVVRGEAYILCLSSGKVGKRDLSACNASSLVPPCLFDSLCKVALENESRMVCWLGLRASQARAIT
jgi:hypothetical protein